MNAERNLQAWRIAYLNMYIYTKNYGYKIVTFHYMTHLFFLLTSFNSDERLLFVDNIYANTVVLIGKCKGKIEVVSKSYRRCI